MKYTCCFFLTIYATVFIASAGTVFADGDLYGSASMRYAENKASDDVTSRLFNTLSFGYQDSVFDNIALQFNGNMTYSNDDQKKYADFIPWFGLSLARDNISCSLNYSDYDNKNYKNASGTLSTSVLSAGLNFSPQDLPAISFNYSVRQSEDDLLPKTTDNRITTYTMNTNYQLGIFYAFYSRNNNKYTNEISGFSTITLSSGISYIATDVLSAVFVSDTANNRIVKYSNDGTYISSIGAGGTASAEFNSPKGVCLDPQGNLYAVDSLNSRVQKFDNEGNFILKWGNAGTGSGEFNTPSGIASDGAAVYVTDTGNNRVQKFDLSGVFVAEWGSTGSSAGEFLGPQGIAADGAYVYVVDANNHRVQKFNADGGFQLQWGTPGNNIGEFFLPSGVSLDASGFVYVADSANNRVQKFTSTGGFVSQWGSYGDQDGQFSTPFGIAADQGNNIYVVDQNNTRIEKFSSNGIFIYSWGKVYIPNAAQKTENVQDSYGVGFSYQPWDFMSVNVNTNFNSSESFKNQEITGKAFQESYTAILSIKPVSPVNISYSLTNQRLRNESQSGQETRQNDINNTLSATLALHRNLSLSSGYSAQSISGDGFEDIDSTTRRAGLLAQPFSKLTASVNYSNIIAENSGEKVSDSDSIGLSTQWKMMSKTSLNLDYYYNLNYNVLADQESEFRLMKAELFAVPMENIVWNLRYEQYAAESRTGSTGTDIYNTYVYYMVTSEISAGANFGYKISEDLEGDAARAFSQTYTSEWHISEMTEFFLSFIAESGAYSSQVISPRLLFRLTDTTALSLNSQKFLKGPSEGDYTAAMELSIRF